MGDIIGIDPTNVDAHLKLPDRGPRMIQSALQTTATGQVDDIAENKKVHTNLIWRVVGK
jgi:hypothetical protein